MGGWVETMFNQFTFIFIKEQHGNILSLHLNKFRKSEKWKNKELKFVNENYISTVPKLLFFKTTDLYTVYLFSVFYLYLFLREQMYTSGSTFIKKI